jgi:hypothetical protein
MYGLVRIRDNLEAKITVSIGSDSNLWLLLSLIHIPAEYTEIK